MVANDRPAKIIQVNQTCVSYADGKQTCKVKRKDHCVIIAWSWTLAVLGVRRRIPGGMFPRHVRLVIGKSGPLC